VKASRAIGIWAAVIAILLFAEVAEITRLFRLPIISALGNLLVFIFALVFITILALIGALFVGIYISQRMQSSGGFTAFEEEMLRMRAEVRQLTDDIGEIKHRVGPPPPAGDPPAPSERRP
jgi:hypothetical protein